VLGESVWCRSGGSDSGGSDVCGSGGVVVVSGSCVEFRCCFVNRN